MDRRSAAFVRVAVPLFALALLVYVVARATSGPEPAPATARGSRPSEDRPALPLTAPPPSAEAARDPLASSAAPEVAPEPAAKGREPVDGRWFLARVVADESGAPLAGARATLVEPDSRRVESDDFGTVRWPLRPLGGAAREELLVSAPGRAPRLAWAEERPDGDAPPAEVRLAPAAELVARVLGSDDPTGLRLLVATPRDALHGGAADPSLTDPLVVEAPFDSAGLARLDALLPRAPLALEVHGAEGLVRRVAEPLVLEPRERREIEIDLAAARVRVTCLDAGGAPAAGVALLLLRAGGEPREGAARYLTGGDEGALVARARTDAEGRAAFEDVAPARYWIGPAPAQLTEPDADPALLAAPVARAFELAPFERERDLVLRVQRSHFLRGRVVDPSGAGVSHAFVGCEHEALPGFVTGDVAEDGTFALGPVAPGAHLVRAIPRGEWADPGPVRALAGGPEIEIRLVPGARISGLVVDASSGAPARAEVTCGRAGDASAPHGSFGDDGAFELGSLGPGRYCVSARTADGRAGIVRGLELEAGETRADVRVELAPAARLVLRRSGGPPDVSFVLRVEGSPVAFGPLADGVDASWTLAPGPVEVQLVAASGVLATRALDARAGETSEAAFELD